MTDKAFPITCSSLWRRQAAQPALCARRAAATAPLEQTFACRIFPAGVALRILPHFPISDSPWEQAGSTARGHLQGIHSSPWSSSSTVIEAEGDSESIEDKSMNNG